jgi:CxxC motif-containing protein (DUF1111 family)
MSYNVLRFTRACMLASIAGVGVAYSLGSASAQTATSARTATDPGPRPLTAAQAANNTQPKTVPSLSDEGFVTFDTPTANLFQQATQRLQEVDSVSGTIATPFPEGGSGLGPRFNSNSCASCHVFPIIGAGSPPGNFTTTDAGGRSIMGNPEVSVANIDGATNVVPSFVTANGPIREAHFVLNPDGTPDGSQHNLYTITGRTDARGCTIAQPNFAQQLAANNVVFRIPINLNGDGLIDSVPDGDQNNNIGLVGAANGQATLRSNLGIGGTFNRSDNDGTITKFGWKAQIKSLLFFSGLAYNGEQGVSNELFPQELDDTNGCQFNPLPEDTINIVNTRNTNSPASDFSSDIENFALFMRLSGPFLPVSPFSSSQSRGQQVFLNIGCGACHIQSQTTTTLSFTNSAANAVGPVTFQPLSDFQLHDMGNGLADGVSQGHADGNQFRSAPLWGAGQRIFFLHDGRTSDIVQAIEAHFSTGSEANSVINNFNALSKSDQQNLVNFLRAL